MPSVRIVADSGCDLPRELVEKLDITIVPVLVRFGQDVVSSDQLTSEAFWSRTERENTPPATSSPAPISFQRAFEKLVGLGHDVVCLTLPAKHSGTFNAAWLAAQEFGHRVRVLDSGSFTLGMGFQVAAAARDALAGRSADFIESAMASLRKRTSVIFALDTLEWVRRGGRLDRVLPLVDRIARTLRVKPIIEMADGEFRLVGIARSSRAALQRLEQEVKSRLPAISIAAAHTRGREAAAELAAALASLANVAPAEVLLAEAGPAFAAHAGPNAVGAVIVRA